MFLWPQFPSMRYKWAVSSLKRFAWHRPGPEPNISCKDKGWRADIGSWPPNLSIWIVLWVFADRWKEDDYFRKRLPRKPMTWMPCVFRRARRCARTFVNNLGAEARPKGSVTNCKWLSNSKAQKMLMRWIDAFPCLWMPVNPWFQRGKNWPCGIWT